MKMKHTARKTLPSLFAALTLAGGLAQAGTPVVYSPGKEPAAEPPPPAAPNPLSFYDGKLVFDAALRLRLEVRENNTDFNSDLNSLNDDGWLLIRSRLGVLIKPTDWLKIYAQGQDSREYDSDRPDIPGVGGAEGDDAFDLRQAYIELGDLKSSFPVTLKVGRQILSYGEERLVGAGEWTNLARTFDAVKLHYEHPKFWVEAFASSVVTFDQHAFNQSDFLNGTETNRDQIFSGIYFSTKALDYQVTDIYAFHLHEEGLVEDTNFVTFGGRIKADPTKLNGWDYELEGGYQTGEVLGRDLSAYFIHAGIGHVFKDAYAKPRIFVEYNRGSGDEDTLDDETNSFQPLFPTNHKFYGIMDNIPSLKNLQEVALTVQAAPVKNITVQAEYHAFWLTETTDTLFAGRPISPGADNYAGSEFDVFVTWKPIKQFSLQVGYAHFFAGDYLSDTGTDDDADFGYVQAAIEF